jgi:hypothetical protein
MGTVIEATTMGRADANAASLEAELAWFARALETRLNLHFGIESAVPDVRLHEPPDLTHDRSEYARVVKERCMSFEERLVLIMALIPHVRPQALDSLLLVNKNTEFRFTEFGGVRGKTHAGLLPTAESASFVVTGTDLAARFRFMQLFQDDHFFFDDGILKLNHGDDGEPLFSGILRLSTEFLNRFTSGQDVKPDYTSSFPAKRVFTGLTWDDLVLPHDVLDEVDRNLNAWLSHANTIMDEWGLGRSVKPGYRCLFYGPPGTGKTLTATLVGARAGLDVYRIDLSMVVSKYIGETEKSLANIFDQARNKNWILFFDEADALFGKRTQTSSSNDRYANQEVSYLLQRVEDFPGVVILATNLKANIDDAFARRFQASIFFPLPDAEHRLKLWQGYFKGRCQLDPDVDLKAIAERHELAGGAIANVVRYAAMQALQAGRSALSGDDLLRGITKELAKEGKTI